MFIAIIPHVGEKKGYLFGQRPPTFCRKVAVVKVMTIGQSDECGLYNI